LIGCLFEAMQKMIIWKIIHQQKKKITQCLCCCRIIWKSYYISRVETTCNERIAFFFCQIQNEKQRKLFSKSWEVVFVLHSFSFLIWVIILLFLCLNYYKIVITFIIVQFVRKPFLQRFPRKPSVWKWVVFLSLTIFYIYDFPFNYHFQKQTQVHKKCLCCCNWCFVFYFFFYAISVATCYFIKD